MVKITEHFTSSEFICKTGAPYPSRWIDKKLYPLCLALEKIRKKIGKPLIITSGYRTEAHNAQVPGSAKDSQHVKGTAADFKCTTLGARALYKIVEEMIQKKEIPDGGLGSYPRHVHYDQGPPGRRWKK